MRRPFAALVACLPLVAVAAGAPATTVPDTTPGEGAGAPEVPAVSLWLSILPAPREGAAGAAVAGGTPREQWPLRGTLTQPFGCTGFERERPAADCPGGFHTGLDIGLPEGAPIRAAGAGFAYPFQDAGRYGNHVLIQEAGGMATVYAHMSRTGVAWGQAVRAGEVIGWVGSTGNSTGPHLHFEVRYAGVPLDPAPYLEGRPADPYPLPGGWPGAARDDWRGRR